MIDINEVYEEINKLENKDYLTYDIVNKLAVLYIVKDHYKPKMTTPVNSVEMEMPKMPMK